jgi:hypothetical protein
MTRDERIHAVAEAMHAALAPRLGPFARATAEDFHPLAEVALDAADATREPGGAAWCSTCGRDVTTCGHAPGCTE